MKIKNKQILAIIPARGGSKGIKKKNLQKINGKPLIGYTIEAAIYAHSISRIIVSTDDNEIANISSMFGAEVIKRPKKISGDNASSESALIQCLDYLEKKEKYYPDILVFLQCTSPFTRPEDIDGVIKKLIDEKADSCFAGAPFHHFLWKVNDMGVGSGINHNKNERVLRQNMKKQYIEAGSVYVMNANKFKKKKHRFFGKTVIYEIQKERCWEIDEPIDLKIAQFLKSIK